MNILLQRLSEGTYLCEDGTWDLNPDRARTFPSTMAALDHTCQHRMENVQIVLRFPNDPNSRYTVGINIQGRKTTPPQEINPNPRTESNPVNTPEHPAD